MATLGKAATNAEEGCSNRTTSSDKLDLTVVEPSMEVTHAAVVPVLSACWVGHVSCITRAAIVCFFSFECILAVRDGLLSRATDEPGRRGYIRIEMETRNVKADRIGGWQESTPLNRAG